MNPSLRLRSATLPLLPAALLLVAAAGCGRAAHQVQPRPQGRSTSTSGSQRFFLTPGRNGASCEMDVGTPGLPTEVWCLSAVRSLSEAHRAIAVSLRASGRIKVCHGLRCVGNGPDEPKLRYGHSISLGPFRCTSLRTCVRCVVKELDHGFLLHRHSVTRV